MLLYHTYERLQKLETVEKTLQTGTKHIEKYYEQYLEKHLDVSPYRMPYISEYLKYTYCTCTG